MNDVDCSTCEANLIDFVHGEVDRATHVALARHLSTCPTCALASCRLRADLDGISAWGLEAPRPAVRDALRAQVEREFGETRPLESVGLLARAWRTLSVPVPAYQAALVAAGVALAVVFGARARQQPDPPRHLESAPVLEGVDSTAPLFDGRLM